MQENGDLPGAGRLTPNRHPLQRAVDAVVRFGYRVAYRCALAWWFVRRPRTHGAAVAVWAGDRILLIRTSYRRRCSLPGGYVRRGEASRDAAARELLEEVKIAVAPDRLTLAYEGTLHVEYHDDRLDVWETSLPSAPDVRANGRELIWVGWKTTEEAMALPLLSHLRHYLAARRPVT